MFSYETETTTMGLKKESCISGLEKNHENSTTDPSKSDCDIFSSQKSKIVWNCSVIKFVYSKTLQHECARWKRNHFAAYVCYGWIMDVPL